METIYEPIMFERYFKKPGNESGALTPEESNGLMRELVAQVGELQKARRMKVIYHNLGGRLVSANIFSTDGVVNCMFEYKGQEAKKDSKSIDAMVRGVVTYNSKSDSDMPDYLALSKALKGE